jgi:ADP-dependent NAD(P)H-hydrate dehydratase / NAD(P)H-hydrate epimerase
MMPDAPHGTPVYLTADVRAIEQAALASPERPPLMERAGLAAAEFARELCAGRGNPLLVVAGPGNNGGDAFVAARHLKEWWFNVTVVFAGDEHRLSADARAALEAWRAAGGSIVREMPPQSRWELIVDGLFGIGLERDITGPYAGWIGTLNGYGAPILALDVPSGLHSDTGRVMGCAVRAAHTLTFIALKPGLLTLDGPDHCGALKVAALGLDATALRRPSGFLLGPDLLHAAFPPRLHNSHKGHYGSVGVVGGDYGMTGAALLAGRAALKLGSGRVYVGLLAEDAPRVDPLQPELMIRTVDEVLKLDHLDCLAVGPGLGQTPDAAFYLDIALTSPLPLVLDADALNMIAADPRLAARLAQRGTATLLTPHPAEAARLLGISTREAQQDRVGTAIELAARCNSLVVLKGNGSICAAPDGIWHINPTGNPGMASAGMGDVLTGMTGAFLAQGTGAMQSLLAAVYVHGAAADELVASGTGPAGLTASEVIDAARRIINRRR